MPYAKECIACSKHFIAREYTQVTCGNKTCQEWRRNENRRKRYGWHLLIKKCVVCDKEFNAKRRAITCSPEHSKVNYQRHKKERNHRLYTSPEYKEKKRMRWLQRMQNMEFVLYEKQRHAKYNRKRSILAAVARQILAMEKTQ